LKLNIKIKINDVLSLKRFETILRLGVLLSGTSGANALFAPSEYSLYPIDCFIFLRLKKDKMWGF